MIRRKEISGLEGIDYLEVLGNFTDKALEGQFADEKFCALLVLSDFTVQNTMY